ncbi:hypothetical protein TNCV_3543221 [Trichonephila clavipes]|nr:hypothetical protein TNCV_3543221 [Trichonephila clavipes]
MKQPGKFEYNRKDKRSPSVNELQQTLRSPLLPSTNLFKDIKTARRKLMQISAENLQEELDLRHVENRQIMKELEKLIQDCKPEKQHLLTSQ